MERQTKAYVYGISTVLIWSTVASAFKISLRFLSPVELLFYSSLFSTVVLFLILVFQKKTGLLLRADSRQWCAGLLFGLLNPFLYYMVLFKCYALLPAQQAQPINMTWGITLALLSVPFLGHRLTKTDLLGIATGYSGVYIISTRGDVFSLAFDNVLGVWLALGSTIIWSLYWILNTRDKRDPVVGLFLNFFCSLPVTGLYLAVTEGIRKVGLQGVGGALYVGCFEMGVSFVLWLLALKYTKSAARITNLIYLAPFISLVLIHFLVGEDIHVSSVIGLCFIVAGLGIQALAKKSVSS